MRPRLMTIIPFPQFGSSHLRFKTLRRHLLRLARPPSGAAARTPAMASTDSDRATSSVGSVGGSLAGYPKPLSPPYPPISKDVELSRAMSAAERSAAFVLSETDVVFEDEWMVVINKPRGIYCETLLASLSSPSASRSELHLANRLDRDTSGLMLVTKSHKAAAKLVKAFTDHQVKKTYLALCVGPAPDWEKIRISSGHGRSRFGAWRVYSASDVGRVLPGGSMVKHMETSFEVLSVNGMGKFEGPTNMERDEIDPIIVEEKGVEFCIDDDGLERDVVLVRAYPQSGRTHQIRLHCQHLGISIRGDVKYGGVHEWKGKPCETHCLHAESLSFEHPITGSLLLFHAPLPTWATEVFGNTMLQDS